MYIYIYIFCVYVVHFNSTWNHNEPYLFLNAHSLSFYKLFISVCYSKVFKLSSKYNRIDVTYSRPIDLLTNIHWFSKLTVIYSFIQQGHINRPKMTSKNMNNVTKDFRFQINTVFYFLLITEEKKNTAAQLFSTLIIIRNVFLYTISAY